MNRDLGIVSFSFEPLDQSNELLEAANLVLCHLSTVGPVTHARTFLRSRKTLAKHGCGMRGPLRSSEIREPTA